MHTGEAAAATATGLSALAAPQQQDPPERNSRLQRPPTMMMVPNTAVGIHLPQGAMAPGWLGKQQRRFEPKGKEQKKHTPAGQRLSPSQPKAAPLHCRLPLAPAPAPVPSIDSIRFDPRATAAAAPLIGLAAAALGKGACRRPLRGWARLSHSLCPVKLGVEEGREEARRTEAPTERRMLQPLPNQASSPHKGIQAWESGAGARLWGKRGLAKDGVGSPPCRGQAGLVEFMIRKAMNASRAAGERWMRGWGGLRLASSTPSPAFRSCRVFSVPSHRGMALERLSKSIDRSIDLGA